MSQEFKFIGKKSLILRNISNDKKSLERAVTVYYIMFCDVQIKLIKTTFKWKELSIQYFRVSHDVTTSAILVPQNNETAAMLVSQTNPVGVGLFSYVNTFFCSNKFCMAAGHVSENAL